MTSLPSTSPVRTNSPARSVRRRPQPCSGQSLQIARYLGPRSQPENHPAGPRRAAPLKFTPEGLERGRCGDEQVVEREMVG